LIGLDALSLVVPNLFQCQFGNQQPKHLGCKIYYWRDHMLGVGGVVLETMGIASNPCMWIVLRGEGKHMLKSWNYLWARGVEKEIWDELVKCVICPVVFLSNSCKILGCLEDLLWFQVTVGQLYRGLRNSCTGSKSFLITNLRNLGQEIGDN